MMHEPAAGLPSSSLPASDHHMQPITKGAPFVAQPPADQPRTEINPSLDPSRLGVRFSGSSREGHPIAMPKGALEAIFRTDEPFQANALLGQCLKVLSTTELGGAEDGAGDERHFMLSAVKDFAPRDVVERMLAVQMAATHVALIRAGGALARATQLPQFEAYSTSYNKLARTFAAQMEALRRHRTGGRQQVTVEHVHVHPGGQAIVGEVHHRGREASNER